MKTKLKMKESFIENRKVFFKFLKSQNILEKRGKCKFLEKKKMADLIANQPVVIDNGSGMIKAGFAGDQVPKCRFPNYVGRPKHVRVMAGALEGEIFIGNLKI